MKISFNLISCGLNNNGGSSTIIKSANVLHKLGNDVTIVDSGKNYNTWNPIECNYLKIKDLIDFPKGDVVIATGFKSVESTLRLSRSCGRKYHYIRGFELWNFNEKDIINKILNNDIIKIVNSIGLQNKLKSLNIESTIVRPGYDFDEIYPLNIIKDDTKVILGGLFNSGSKRSTKRTEWIFEAYEKLKKKYDIKLFMFGSDGVPKKHVDLYIRNPKIEEKNKIYNMVDIWCSPSELEGLHITPAEAMLAQCAVVGNNSELSGTKDYLQNTTGLTSNNNLKDFIKCIEKLILDKPLRLELGKKGREKIISLGNRKNNMKKMIEAIRA